LREPGNYTRSHDRTGEEETQAQIDELIAAGQIGQDDVLNCRLPHLLKVFGRCTKVEGKGPLVWLA
jgi:hypothetical protein